MDSISRKSSPVSNEPSNMDRITFQMSMRHLPERISGKLALVENGCWSWAGCYDRNGYARAGGFGKYEGRVVNLSRAIYDALYFSTTRSVRLRRCDYSKRCVNPDHHKVDTINVTGGQIRRKFCVNGHTQTEENRRYRTDGKFVCRLCQHMYAVESHRRSRAQRKAQQCQP